MKKPFLLPLLASSLLVACATPVPGTVQNRPTVIGEQDIQRMAQQGQERALNARDGTAEHPVLAGMPPRKPPEPVIKGGIRAPMPPTPALPAPKR